MAAIAGMGLPIYRAGSLSSFSNPIASAQADPEIADQGVAVTSSTSQSDDVQIPTRLTAHTNGTVSVWFQGEASAVYRIDYAETKAATLTAMVWKVAADEIQVVTNSWTEWVDTGVADRPSPREVNERYYRVVLKTKLTATTTVEATQGSPAVPTTGPASVSSGGSGNDDSPGSIPTEILRMLEKQGSLSQWTQSRSARYLAELQECERLGELVAGGTATEAALKDALAKSKLRISMLMTLGQNLLRSGDRRHALMFFEAIVQHHAKRATAKQVARCYLQLGKIHHDVGLEWQYSQRQPDQAEPEFKAAAANYLAAKDTAATNDWVRAVGRLQAAACYRELGNQVSRSECLEQLLAEGNSMPVHRDLATYLLANTYSEQKRWHEAAQVYRQMQEQLTGRTEQYQGQSKYLGLINTSLGVCEAQQTKVAQSLPLPAATNQTKGQVPR